MIFIIQCNKCGNWRVAETNNLPEYKFKCVKSNCERSVKPRKMRVHGYYAFNFREVYSKKEAEIRIRGIE